MSDSTGETNASTRNTGYSSITLASWLEPWSANADDASTVAVNADPAAKTQSQPSHEQELSQQHSSWPSVAISAEKLLSQDGFETQQQAFFATVSGDASPTQQLFVGATSQQQAENAASAGATIIANTAKNAARFAKRRVQRYRIIEKSNLCFESVGRASNQTTNHPTPSASSLQVIF